MTRIEYTLFNNLLPDDIPVPEINCNLNLFNIVIDGVNLALYARGANGCIKGNDHMRVLHHNSNGQRVCIGIAGDHQLAPCYQVV